MRKKKILTVGFKLGGGDAEHVLFESDWSLLDADIVLFEPSLGEAEYEKRYNGKPLLTERSSAEVSTRLTHWHSELRSALAAGKLIVIFLTKPLEVFVHTGEKAHSGTGRSRVTINLVRPVTSYAAVPHLTGVTPKSGTEIVPNGKVGFFAPFWAEFRDYCEPYEVWIEGKFSDVLLHTKTGDKVIGAAVGQGGGTMLFLPPFRYRKSKPRTSNEGGKEKGPTEGQWGKKMVAALVNLADVFANERAATPPPSWVNDAGYRLPQEAVLASQILDVQRRLGAIEAEKQQLEQQLIKEGSLRRLLYEQGNPLEEAILETLRLMGFTAESFKDGDSEFDAIFSSPEGRFLGEAEGKDNRAVNIDKFSQLERNLHEDFDKSGMGEFAKGVLFGNGFRLAPPGDRAEVFTEKCFTAAKRIGAALIRTPDLFAPARYLKSCEDADYGRRCREAIFAAKGEVVIFPSPPAAEAPGDVATREGSSVKETGKEPT
ncbi:MAG TPA: hypothetical protein VH643_24955 [Gemmataceae bacterium]